MRIVTTHPCREGQRQRRDGRAAEAAEEASRGQPLCCNFILFYFILFYFIFLLRSPIEPVCCMLSFTSVSLSSFMQMLGVGTICRENIFFFLLRDIFFLNLKNSLNISQPESLTTEPLFQSLLFLFSTPFGKKKKKKKERKWLLPKDLTKAG